MHMPRYTFQRGETISIPLNVAQGDIATVSSISAHARKLLPGKTELTASTPIAADFSISQRDATTDVPAGWTLTIHAAQSATLSAGNYLVDARIGVGGGIFTTTPVMLVIKEPATL